ncbi:MAG: addiction module toxin, HicA family [Anaerolineales bacterium]|nr:addiction module toxin, HicA family [Anaerolineales bacterium]
MSVRKKHQRTLDALFEEPTRSNIAWNDIIALFDALDAEISEGKGFRVRVALGGARAVFHRPLPSKDMHKSMVRSIRRFLKTAGVKP